MWVGIKECLLFTDSHTWYFLSFTLLPDLQEVKSFSAVVSVWNRVGNCINSRGLNCVSGFKRDRPFRWDEVYFFVGSSFSRMLFAVFYWIRYSVTGHFVFCTCCEKYEVPVHCVIVLVLILVCFLYNYRNLLPFVDLLSLSYTYYSQVSQVILVIESSILILY